MKWQGRRGSSNVRSSTGGGKMLGGGIGGIIIAGILWLVFGVNPMTALQTGQAVTGGGSESSTELATSTVATHCTQPTPALVSARQRPLEPA